MPVSTANGIDICCEVAGRGPALVMIHALPFDHNLWLYQVERFSKMACGRRDNPPRLNAWR